MKKLVIVESPTKAKTISGILAKDDARVLASMGHIRDIPESGVNVDMSTFKPKYVISASKKEIVKEMKSELSNADELYLATDEDREGESISWHLMEVLKPKVPVKRMVFHEITPSAIRRAFSNTRGIDMDMVSAQESRRVLDRLVGYGISPLLWKTIGDRHLSAGRVQSPCLRLVVEREYARMSFVSAGYCVIKAVFLNASGEKIEAKLVGVNGRKTVSGKDDFDPETGKIVSADLVLLDEGKAAECSQAIRNAEWFVRKVTKRETRIQPPVPFITSTLQQEASSRLRFAPSKTMLVAQHLYEKGFITYMRTDSPTLSEDGEGAIRAAVEKAFSRESLSDAPRRFKSKDENAQNAHEAIRPAIIDGRIKTARELSLTADEAKLYALIWRRSLACQMTECIRESTNLRICDGANAYEFSASGFITIQDGFRLAYEADEKDDSKSIPEVEEGDGLALEDLSSQSMKTSPPRRWTEAALIREMEKLGIGRPSTYASTISAIINRKYVQKQDGALVPTFTGLIVIKFLSSHLSKYLDYGFTSNMEESLDGIENGKVNELEYLKGFYYGENGLKESLEFDSGDRREQQRLPLPGISGKYSIHVGKFGPYVTHDGKSCSIPSDVYPYMMTDELIARLFEEKESGKTRPAFEAVAVDGATGKSILYNGNGKYGPYFFIEGEKKSVRVPRGCKREDLTEEEIAKLFSIPCEIARDGNGAPVILNSGRYGYYLSYNGKNASVKDALKALCLTADEAFAMFKDKA